MAVYSEDFYALLERIQNNYVTTVRQIPLDEPRIQVDLNTRVIKISESEYSDFLSMAEDHRAETVYFETDRYFEDVDLFNCTCVVEYLNAGGEARLYPVTLKDVESLRETGRMLLAWNIGNEATAYSGVLRFSLIFYKIDETSHSFLYALHTLPAEGNVLNGMEYTPAQETEKEDYYAINEKHYESLLAIINQKNVYWNDL